jgi:hypothetical protein
VVSTTGPYGRILEFLDRKDYLHIYVIIYTSAFTLSNCKIMVSVMSLNQIYEKIDLSEITRKFSE